MMGNLENLLERVKAAPGREIALEREIMCAIGGWHRLSPSQHPRNHKHPMFVDTQEGYGTFEGRALYRDVPRIMESVDAALALVERVLPGTASERTSWRGHYRCTLIQTDGDGWHNGGKHFRIDAQSEASEPLAIIAALLSSLVQNGGDQ